jgi:hypothetical protein
MLKPQWCSELGRPVKRGLCPRHTTCPHPFYCQAPPPPKRKPRKPAVVVEVEATGVVALTAEGQEPETILET